MKIEVLGTGCPKCRKVEQMIRNAAAKLDVAADITHVTDVSEITRRGVLMTPAVFVDGEKVSEGKVPAEKEIESWLKRA